MRYVQKDQTYCPKCRRMYCEGYWGEGVCTADMNFCGEPTADADAVADYVRTWYEINRETWWDRHRRLADRKGIVADNFILSLIGEVRRVQAERDRQLAAIEERRRNPPPVLSTNDIIPRDPVLGWVDEGQD